MQREHYWYLDGLRGLAAFAVVLLHWLDGHGVELFGSSILAVDFFFLLSGFVIQISYRNRLESRSDLRRFAVKRVIRLYPLVLLSVVLGVLRFVLLAVAEPGSRAMDQLAPAGVTAHLLLLPSSAGAVTELFPLNVPLWSLHFEMLLYGLFAVLLVGLSRRSLAVVVLLAVPGLVWWVSTAFGSNPVEPPVAEYPISLARAVMSFALGVLMARVHRKDGWFNRNLNGIFGRRVAWFASLPLAAFILPAEVMPVPVVLILILVGFPLVICLGVNVDLSPTGRKLAKLAGDLSYPVYVLHLPMMWIMSGSLKTVGLFDRPIYNGILVVPAVLGVSAVALRLFDQPVRARLNAFHRSRVARAAT